MEATNSNPASVGAQGQPSAPRFRLCFLPQKGGVMTFEEKMLQLGILKKKETHEGAPIQEDQEGPPKEEQKVETVVKPQNKDMDDGTKALVEMLASPNMYDVVKRARKPVLPLIPELKVKRRRQGK